MSDFSASNLSSPNDKVGLASLTEWLNYMQQIHVSAIDMGLSRVLPVAEALGVVQSAKDDAYVFTVAGTNGKGSTTAVIAEMCKAAGYKTALYQSPHLSVFNERVRINGEMVSDETLIHAFSKVESARLACDLTLSFFEMTTLAALLIFAEADCDVWVLEVGLGGRLDVVNIIDPDMAVITNIGIDHVDWLGDNVEDIGREKAGILRQGIPLIYGATAIPSSVQHAIDEKQATCYQIGQDFSYRDIDSTTWQYSNAAVTLQLPRPALSLTNTANALSAVILIAQLLPFWQQHVAKHSSQTDKGMPKINMLFSMLGDKDIDMVVQRLTQAGLPISDWYLAEIDYPRAASTEQLEGVLAKYIDSDNIHECDGLYAATHAVVEASQPQDLIVVCGSFHTIGEALSALTV